MVGTGCTVQYSIDWCSHWQYYCHGSIQVAGKSSDRVARCFCGFCRVVCLFFLTTPVSQTARDRSRPHPSQAMLDLQTIQEFMMAPHDSCSSSLESMAGPDIDRGSRAPLAQNSDPDDPIRRSPNGTCHGPRRRLVELPYSRSKERYFIVDGIGELGLADGGATNEVAEFTTG